MFDEGQASSEEVRETASTAPDAPVGRVRLDEIGARGRAIASQISRLQAEQVTLATEVNELAGFLVPSTPAAWIGWQWGLTGSESHRLTDLGRRLPALPLLTEAFSSGQLSEGTVVSLAKVATPDNEATLVETAKVATGAQLVTLVRRYRQVEVPNPQADPRGIAPEAVEARADADGWVNGRIRLGPERGALFLHALEEACRDAKAEDPPSERELLAARDGRSGAEMHWASRADGFMNLVEAAIEAKGGPSVVGPRYQVVIHAKAEAIARGEARDDEVYFQDGGAFDLGVLGELACESTLRILVEQYGRPITLTLPVELATPSQRLALYARDRCCSYPGCGRTKRLKAHHIRFRSKRGKTRLSNLVLLCQFHHSLIHKPGWSLSRNDRTVEVIICRPDGTRVRYEPRPPPSDEPPDPDAPDDETERLRGTGEVLTHYAADVVVQSWQEASAGGVDDGSVEHEERVYQRHAPDDPPERDHHTALLHDRYVYQRE